MTAIPLNVELLLGLLALDNVQLANRQLVDFQRAEVLLFDRDPAERKTLPATSLLALAAGAVAVGAIAIGIGIDLSTHAPFACSLVQMLPEQRRSFRVFSAMIAPAKLLRFVAARSSGRNPH
jgi:hypothetical protein